MTVPPIAISIVALCAVLSTVADRTPRVRIIALAVGVALASLC